MTQDSASEIKGKVYSTESFASVDGPGVRFAVFMQGCRMRCRYCHNPDAWKIDSGREMTVEQILDAAERYRPYWGEKGGITVSGGEPLLQIDFLTELFREAKRRGIHTCIDTSAQPYDDSPNYRSRFDELMRYTDLLLFDIKHIDPVKHKRLTGFDNSNILMCLQHLSESGKPVWIRYVLVPGITDDEDDLRNTGTFLKTLKNIERIEVLPYHTLGVHKYKSLGIDYPLEGVKPPSKDSVRTAESLLSAKYL